MTKLTNEEQIKVIGDELAECEQQLNNFCDNREYAKKLLTDPQYTGTSIRVDAAELQTLSVLYKQDLTSFKLYDETDVLQFYDLAINNMGSNNKQVFIRSEFFNTLFNHSASNNIFRVLRDRVANRNTALLILNAVEHRGQLLSAIL